MMGYNLDPNIDQLYFVPSIKGTDNSIKKSLLLHYFFQMIIHNNLSCRSKVGH